MMEVNIINEFENPLLERKEIVAIVSFQGPTPKTEEVIDALSRKLKVKETHIEVEKILQLFGKTEAKVYAYIYNKPVREEKKEEAKEEGENKEEEKN